MTLDEVRVRLETIRSDADNALQILSFVDGNAAKPPAPAPALPETLTAELVRSNYTHKGTNDLYVGVRDGIYPKPITPPGARRLWTRESWDNWKNANA